MEHTQSILDVEKEIHDRTGFQVSFVNNRYRKDEYCGTIVTKGGFRFVCRAYLQSLNGKEQFIIYEITRHEKYPIDRYVVSFTVDEYITYITTLKAPLRCILNVEIKEPYFVEFPYTEKELEKPDNVNSFVWFFKRLGMKYKWIKLGDTYKFYNIAGNDIIGKCINLSYGNDDYSGGTTWQVIDTF